jgi:hypothetical protein
MKRTCLVADQTTVAGLVCYGGCGRRYEDFGLDVLLPTRIWNQITVGAPFDPSALSPDDREGRGGVLCAQCIVDRLAKLPGVTAAYIDIEDKRALRADEGRASGLKTCGTMTPPDLIATLRAQVETLPHETTFEANGGAATVELVSRADVLALLAALPAEPETPKGTIRPFADLPVVVESNGDFGYTLTNLRTGQRKAFANAQPVTPKTCATCRHWWDSGRECWHPQKPFVALTIGDPASFGCTLHQPRTFTVTPPFCRAIGAERQACAARGFCNREFACND